MIIHHVGFLTKNLKKSESEFLGLGFEIEKEAKFDHIRKVNISFLINNGYRVELIEPVGKDSPLYPLLKHYKNTPYHFCYESENFDKDIKKLSENGYAVINEPKVAPCINDGSKQVCFLISTNTGIIELLEK
jgi:methylmalonyl-CoA/ethylmalonyl-CoA epimerase